MVSPRGAHPKKRCRIQGEYIDQHNGMRNRGSNLCLGFVGGYRDWDGRRCRRRSGATLELVDKEDKSLKSSHSTSARSTGDRIKQKDSWHHRLYPWTYVCVRCMYVFHVNTNIHDGQSAMLLRKRGMNLVTLDMSIPPLVRSSLHTQRSCPPERPHAFILWNCDFVESANNDCVIFQCTSTM